MKKLLIMLAVLLALQACKPLGYAVVERFETADGRAFPWKPSIEGTKIYPERIEFEDGSKHPVERIDYNAGLAWRRLKSSPDVVVCYEFRKGRMSLAQKVLVAMDTSHRWASSDIRLDELNHQLCEDVLREGQR